MASQNNPDAASPKKVLPRSMQILRLLAILGPGILAMAGDNDAGGLLSYLATGARYGTGFFLPLLFGMVILTLMVQDMALRIGLGLGQSLPPLIRQVAGRGWAHLLSVQLAIQDWFTLISEFAGMGVALAYFGIPLLWGVPLALLLILLLLLTRSYRTMERIAVTLAILNLLLVPAVFLAPHLPALPPPALPRQLSPVFFFFAVGMVGNATAPWMPFFQTQAARDRGLTPRDLPLARLDLLLGGLFQAAVAGVVLLLATIAPAHTFLPSGFLANLAHHTGPLLPTLVAFALLDAGLVAAVTVSLTTAWTVAETWTGQKSSDHKNPLVRRLYLFGLVTAALVVWIPGAPLALLAVGAQVVSALLMPSLLLLLLQIANLPAMGGVKNRLASNAVGVLALVVFASATVILLLAN